MTEQTNISSFAELGLASTLVKRVAELGFTAPTPIQAQAIPVMLEKRDVIGMAQTGTGKTAAFALPLLTNLGPTTGRPQLLILAPTRELACQVADAISLFSKGMKNVQVQTIVGGQSYRDQLTGLKRGANIIVGTPGRVMDHLERGKLKLDQIEALVLDEADEMLRMGFIEEVTHIMQRCPDDKQTVLFSATMPAAIRKIANEYLHQPESIKIAAKTTTASNIEQSYVLVNERDKMLALTRLLHAEETDGVIIFAKTKLDTVDLSAALRDAGFNAACINGDMAQPERDKTVAALKKGRIDILAATDVVARGLDVERVSHVINFDLPNDTESYVHRIGRTGRAGRAGKAISIMTLKQRGFLQKLERTTRHKLQPQDLPSVDALHQHQLEQFAHRLQNNAGQAEHNTRALLSKLLTQTQLSETELLAALLHDHPAYQLLNAKALSPVKPAKISQKKQNRKSRGKEKAEAVPMQRYRINVGRKHGVKPGNIVGAISNEAQLASDYIGRIDIRDDHSLVDLPQGMPKAVYQILRKTRVCHQALNLIAV